VTTKGPADRPEFEGVTPSVAYDRRSDGYVLVHAGTTRGDVTRGELFSQRLSADGKPLGGVRRLDLRPGADSAAPLARLAPDPAGGVLPAFTWGPVANGAELYTTKLDANGRPGRVRAISKPGGPGAAGVELAPASRGREALVVWADARSGASSGFRARLLRADGRPARSAVELPFRQGAGAVVVAPLTDASGWRYAFLADDRSSSCEICRRVSVRRARRDGRALGATRTISPSGVLAANPLLAPLRRGAHVVGWDEPPVSGPGGTTAARSRVRTVG